MALLEINLRKPALMEEVVDEDAKQSTRGRSSRTRSSQERTGGGGSVLRKVGMVGFVVAALVIAQAVRSRRSSSASKSEGIEVPIEDGSSESSSGSQGRRIAGIVLAVLGAVVVARRMQSGQRE